MKKLLTLLFSSVLAVSLALPVFAQDAAGKTAAKSSTTKPTHKKHHKKGAKRTKKHTSSTAPAGPTK